MWSNWGGKAKKNPCKEAIMKQETQEARSCQILSVLVPSSTFCSSFPLAFNHLGWACSHFLDLSTVLYSGLPSFAPLSSSPLGALPCALSSVTTSPISPPSSASAGRLAWLPFPASVGQPCPSLCPCGDARQPVSRAGGCFCATEAVLHSSICRNSQSRGSSVKYIEHIWDGTLAWNVLNQCTNFG